MTNPKLERKKKDKAWSTSIRERDVYCQVCGPVKINKVLNAHHLIPRMFVEFRWDLNNGMLLCFSHHSLGRYSAHQHPVWFSEWLRLEQPKIFEWIKLRII